MRKRTFLFFCRVFCVFTISATSQAADSPIQRLTPYISKGGYALQIDGQIVRSANLNTFFIPASTIKVLTGLMALEILGPEYRYATRFFLDQNNVLYIRGEGDPFLTSEVIVSIAEMLKQHGVTQLEKLVLDDSAFALEGPPPGSTNTHNPYDAHSGALVVNFNAIPFIVTANGKVVTGERQTPFLPMMRDYAKGYKKGSYRVNVSAYPARKGHSNMLRFTGELFTAIFIDQNIKIAKAYEVGKTPDSALPILVYESDKTVAELVRSCLYYSSNFIANQLYLSCGRRVFGFPATWQKSERMVKKYLHLRLQLPENALHMEDGSGLSTKNRISPAAMLTILNRFSPHAALMKKSKGAYIKSGTLTGVYSYVGYFMHKHTLSPFVLFLNQRRNNRKQLLNLMHNEFTKLQP